MDVQLVLLHRMRKKLAHAIVAFAVDGEAVHCLRCIVDPM